MKIQLKVYQDSGPKILQIDKSFNDERAERIVSRIKEILEPTPFNPLEHEQMR